MAGVGIGDVRGRRRRCAKSISIDLARNRIGDIIIVQTNPETEILVFSGGELALEGGHLIVIARHARIDGDTVIRSFRLPTRFAKPGEPNQAARGADGMSEGAAGGNGAPGGSGICRR